MKVHVVQGCVIGYERGVWPWVVAVYLDPHKAEEHANRAESVAASNTNIWVSWCRSRDGSPEPILAPNPYDNGRAERDCRYLVQEMELVT